MRLIRLWLYLSPPTPQVRSKKEILPLSEIERLNKRPKMKADLQAMEEDSAGWFAK